MTDAALLFADDFDADRLNEDRWLPVYLPHWSSLERTRARYRIQDSILALRIDPDQQPWCPAFDPGVKVSNLQTGHCSGPVGSHEGQHRFRPDLTVHTALPPRRLFTPHYCRLEMRARARLNPWNLAALWLIGWEDRPERSGEITVFEVFGRNRSAAGTKIGRGVKAVHDPVLTTEIDESPLPLDVGDWHTYGMVWRASGIEFLIDGRCVTHSRQSPDYPMQLMLNLYDLPGDDDRTGAVQEVFEVDYIRAWKNET